MKHLLLYLIFSVSFFSSFSQNTGIGVGTTNPHPSAEFEINSTNKGFLPPRLTTSQRDSISNPASGLQIFNTTTSCLQMYAYGVWQNVFCAKDPMDSLLRVGLVAYYPFSGNAGDSSGNGNHGIVSGPTLTSDRYGNANSAYFFNKNFTQGIFVNSSSTLNSCTQISINLWANLRSNSINNYNRYLNKGTFGGYEYVFANQWAGMYFYYDNLQFYQTSTFSPLNSWHMLSVTYSYQANSNNNFCRFYVDGVLTDSFATSRAIVLNNGNLSIGSEPNFSGCTPDGALDDIRIYNRVLTQAEITYLATH